MQFGFVFCFCKVYDMKILTYLSIPYEVSAISWFTLTSNIIPSLYKKEPLIENWNANACILQSIVTIFLNVKYYNNYHG